MNEFRRYASSATLRQLWPTLRGTFSQEFVRFCEQEFMLPGQLPGPVEFTMANDALGRAYESLRNEFAREWPARLAYLEESVQECRSSPSDDHRAWLIVNEEPQPFAYGIAMKIARGKQRGPPRP